MVTKVFIFGLLCNLICTDFSQYVIQASSPPDEKPEVETEKSPKYDVVGEGKIRDCEPKIISYKDKIPLLISMINHFTALTEKHKLDSADKILIEDERDHVTTMTDDFIAKFDPDLDKLRSMSGARARADWCAHEMKVYLKIRRNLTLAGKRFKEDVLDILNHTSRFLPNHVASVVVPNYPKHVRDDFDQVLSEIVNWLFIIDLGSNMMVDTGKLLKKLYESIRKKIHLEKLWTMTKDGEVDLPETADVMYEDVDVNNEEFEEDLKRERNDILDKSFDTPLEVDAERTDLLKSFGRAEDADVAKSAEVAKNDMYVDEVLDIF